MTASRWSVQSPDAIACCDWGDEWVVFCGDRAETHLFSATAGMLLGAMLEDLRPALAEDLFRRVFGEAMTAREGQDLVVMLEEFERRGLVARFPA